MFRTLIYPSSVILFSVHCVLEIWCGWVWVAEASACNMDTTQTQLHQISNTQWTENKTTDVVIQQHSCELLMMDILMSETCWVHKKWNKIVSDIKLVFYSSTITMMHGPINTRFTRVGNYEFCLPSLISIWQYLRWQQQANLYLFWTSNQGTWKAVQTYGAGKFNFLKANVSVW